MSRSIDQRIVEMKFDNAQFEKNAGESLSTLDKLKEKLSNFGLKKSEIDTSGIDSYADSVEKAGGSFSILEEIATGALRRIGEMAADFGVKMVKDLTIGQVGAGWDKYADMTSSVQTIMAATRAEAQAAGLTEEEQMAMVNAQLDRLNWFADETSYSLLDMTSNVGKFINQGVALDDAVTSMQGISTWAALSGANAQEASRAMYNLSQAMGTGKVSLIDWKSIENANMATREFKELALQAAVAHGTLEDLGGEYMTVKGDVFDINTFNTQLTKSGWFTNDVLTDVLGQYGTFAGLAAEAQDALDYDTTMTLLKDVDAYKKVMDELGAGFSLEDIGALKGTELESHYKRLQEIMRETGASADDLHEIFGELASDEHDLGRRAFKAAQETKTFSEAINATFDAVSTKWMKIFQTIFGDYNEAKALWSGFVEELYTVFVSPLDAVIELLNGTGDIEDPFEGQGWKQLGGREALFNSIANIWTNIKNILGAVAKGFGEVFDAINPQQLVNITKAFENFTKKIMANEKVLNAITSVSKVFFTLLKGAGTIIGGVISAVARLAGALFDFIATNKTLGLLFDALVWLIDSFGAALDFAGSHASAFWQAFKQTEAFTIFSNAISTIASILASIFGPAIEWATGWIRYFAYQLELAATDGTLVVKFAQAVSDGFLMIMGAIKSLMDMISKTRFGEVMIDIANQFNYMLQNGFTVDGVLGIFTTIRDAILEGLSGIWNAFVNSPFNLFGLVGKAFEGTKGIAEGLWNGWKSIDISGLIDVARNGSIAFILAAIGLILLKFAGLVKKIGSIPLGFKKVLGEVRDTLIAYQQYLRAKTLRDIAISIGILAAAIYALGAMKPEALKQAAGGLTLIIGSIIGLLYMIDKIRGKADKIDPSKPLATIAEGITAAMEKFTKAAGIGVGIAGFGIAIGIIVWSLNKLMSIQKNKEAFKDAVLALVVIGAALLIGIGKMNNIKLSKSVPAAFIALGIALGILVGVAALIMKLMSWNFIGAIGILALICVGLVYAMDQLHNLKVDPKSILSMVGLAIAMNLLIPPLMALTLLGGKGFLAAIEVLGLVFGIAASSQLVDSEGMKVLALGLLAISAALYILTPALIQLDQIGIGALVKFAAVIGGLLIIGALVGFIGPLATGLEIVATVCIALGAAMLLAGAGVALFGVGIEKLAGNFIPLAQQIASSGTVMAEAFLVILDNIALAIEQGYPKILKIVITVINALIFGTLQALAEGVKQIAQYIIVIVNTLLDTLRMLVPFIVDSLVTIVALIIKGLVYIIPALLDEFLGNIPVVGKFTGKLREAARNWFTIGKEGGENFTNGAAEGIEGNAGIAEGAVEKTGSKLGGIFGALKGMFSGNGGEIMSGLSEGMTANSETAVGAAQNVASNVVNGLSSKGTEVTAVGSALVNKFIGGATEASGSATAAGETVGNAAIEGLNTSTATGMENYGSMFSQFIEGKIDTSALTGVMEQVGAGGVEGLNQSIPNYETAAFQIPEAVAFGIEGSEYDINSMMSEMGMEGVEGFEMTIPEYEMAGAQVPQFAGMGVANQTGMFSDLVKAMGDEGAIALEGTAPSYETAARKQAEAAAKGTSENAQKPIDANKDMANKALAEVDNEKIIAAYKKAGVEDTTALEQGLRDGTIKPEEAIKDLTEIMRQRLTEQNGKKVAELWRESGYEDAEAVAKGIEEGTIDVAEATKELVRRTEAEMEDMDESGYRGGKRFGDGVAEGIRDKEDSVRNAAGALADAANAEFNSRLAIQSPSKVMMWSGRMFDEGVAVGMLSEISTVTKASGSVANAAMESVREGLSDMTTMLDDDMNFNPVIRPVMDLSDVQNGTASMNGMFGSISTGFAPTGFSTPEARLLELMHGYMDQMNQQEPYGPINIYVQPPEGVNTEEVADRVMTKLNNEITRRKAAWA